MPLLSSSESGYCCESAQQVPRKSPPSPDSLHHQFAPERLGLDYSALMAAKILSFDARKAGRSPAITPTSPPTIATNTN